MRNLGLNEIRKEFLDFFKEKDHIVLKSFPLIPQDDNSLLLVNAGMAPLKKYFTGELKMAKDRACSSQRCIRTGDIDSVGITQRHGTFFEMLGNFSFGDYFKKEAIEWSWEFLNKKMEIPEEVLWVSVYEEDDEAYNIWKNEIGIPEEKIVRLGKEDNFWELEVGPCGPCSEIHVDRGEKYGCGSPDCKPGCDCDRFLEVWNLVFTQFNKDSDGVYHKLANPNIDTGMGLERITMVLENADNIFEIGLVKDIISKIEKLSNKKYKENDKDDISIRIIADHARAITFLVYDGVVPSNEGRGYVLRRLLRRASRHGKLLGIKGNFITEVSKVVMEVYKSEYPELLEEQERIFKILNSEENKFQETIDQGLVILESIIAEANTNKLKVIDSKDAFKLYDTYGFPIDLTVEILEENNMSVDIEKFNMLMEEQRNRSRESRNEDNIGWSSKDNLEIKSLEATEFLGYNLLNNKSKIKRIFVNDNSVGEIKTGEKGIIVVEESSFYGESGGQVGDQGIIKTKDSKAIVINTTKNKNNAILHHVEVENGTFRLEEEVEMKVDIQRRRDTMKNHTATHLLHKALREVLGNHVHQAGSYVSSERLRFDITHFEAISKDDLLKVQNIVNDVISLGMPVNSSEMTLEESTKLGAIGLFEDKYKDVVRVINIGNGYSTELCGGTHVVSTSDIQMLKIISESSVAAGIRRIEAITGRSVYEDLKANENLINDISSILKSDKNEITHRIENIQKEVKSLEKQITSFKEKDSKKDLNTVLNEAKEIQGIKVIIHKFENLDTQTFRNLGDTLKDKLGTGIIILSNLNKDKLNFLTIVTKDLTNKVSAGDIVKQVAIKTGGNGGGRRDFAMAGGKDITKVDIAINSVVDILNELIK
ncbi:alanine--tRNA ligase [Miniphocaeibacter massiliensis]|uniref:alanine--tRNA ligase n=1 Tax=Miniphocaeibacter massiliensis TaxID=2041841 RepID=UPI000C088DC6|nr:alanine--tRNA ligase [Miniphocaeibacter massiliensis]